MPAPPTWDETEAIPAWDETEPIEESTPPPEREDYQPPPLEPEIPRPSVGATGYWGAGATGTWEDESGIPPEISTEQTRRIRAGVDLLAARLQGDKEQREAESLGEQYRSIERFTPAGVMNQPERIARALAAPNAPEIPERFQPGEAIFPIPEPKGTSAMAGLGQLGVQTLNSLQTPEMLVTAPAAVNPVGRALFAADMGRHIPEQVEQGARVVGDIESTPAEKVVAGGTPVIAGTMTALLGKSEIPRPVITERVIAKTEAAVPGALNKSIEALKKVEKPADKTSVETKPTEVTDASKTPETETQPAAPAQEAAVAREPARAQGGEESALLLNPEPDITARLQAADSLAPEALKAFSGERGRGPTALMHEIGSKAKTPQDVAALKQAALESGQKVNTMMEAGDFDGAMAQAGKQLGEAYEYATGVKVDGTPKWTMFEKDNPNYKPPVPDAQYIKAKSGEQITKGGNKITPETQPERIVVQAEQDLGGGEKMPGYVTIQSKGNAQSGPVEAWRAAGHEIPDTTGLPSGTYTVAELKARTVNEKAKTQTQPGLGGAGEQTLSRAAEQPASRLPGAERGAEATQAQPTPVTTPEVTAKRTLPAAETKLAEIVNQTIEQSSPTRLGVSPAASMRPTDVVLGAPDLRSISPAVEARWQAAVKGTETLLDKVKQGAEGAWKSITREYAGLPPREFPAEIDVLRRLRASRNASARTTVDVLKGITHNLGPKQYGVFNRVALLEDLVKDVEAGKYADGRDLPFGYKDSGELTADLSKFRSVSEATPQIKAALERRQEFMDSLRNTLVERGFLPESILQDPRYFHHQVLLYMAEKNAATGSRSFRDWFSGWQKKRTGSSLDYNRQYVESEAAVLSDAFNKVTMQDLQGEMRGIADLTAELKELHGAEWQQHIPKTHTLWQPKRGNAFYPVQTVAERVMDRYLSGLGDILPSEFKEAMAVGGRRQEWVVPKPLAKVLDNIAPRPDTWIDRIASAGVAGWKRYILLNPLRAAKYNLNNLSGDLDFLFAAQPKIFKEFKSSASDMWGFHVKGKSAVGDIKEAMQDGVIGSGWRASELPDIARSDYFNWLTGEKPKLVDRYWDWIGKRNDAREDTGRLASYRFAKKEWEAGRPFYGASVPADVNALATPRLKAAKVAREILIDYGRETEFGNFMRQKFVPFYRWMHGNFARYQQLIRNIPEQEGAAPRVAGATAKKAATLTARMAAAYGIVNLWNHLFFPDEEEELGEGRNQLHLILGRDDTGNIQTIRFQGALSDLLGWVGGENLPQDVEDLATGKATAGDKMEDAYEAAISRAVNASSPFAKTAAEIGLGRSFYPNALEPRPVRDKAEHAAGLFSLKPVYQWLAGKPHKPLRQELANLISYTTDPGEAAYNTTRHMAGEWLEEHGEERANVIPGKRSNALYYYKQALRYKDQEMAQKFLNEYNMLGGKREGLSQSIKASAPLSMLGTKRKAFLDSLSPQEREAVRRAEEWYRKVYRTTP